MILLRSIEKRDCLAGTISGNDNTCFTNWHFSSLLFDGAKFEIEKLTIFYPNGDYFWLFDLK